MKTMKKTTAAAWLLVGWLGVGTAQAVPVIGLQPAVSTVTVGDTFSVDVVVSGLANEYLGAYDLTLGWDGGLLALQGVTFDVYLDGPADSLAGYADGAGTVNVYEVSLGTLANQTGNGSFRLFSLSFGAIGAGATALSFTSLLLSDALGGEYVGAGFENGRVSVASAPTGVPEPGALLLLLTGLGGMAMLLRVDRGARAVRAVPSRG
jgi:hypothetical protein